MEISKDFNADMRIDSTAALIFNAWADHLTRNLFSRLGYLFSETYGDRNYRGALLAQIRNPNSPWCDDPRTEKIETCLESSNAAFDKALEYLSHEYGNDPSKWAWGKAHIATSEHRPLSKVPVLSKLFNLEVPFPGDSNTVNVGRLELLRSKNPYGTLQGPSMRAIYDLSDLEKSLFIYQTGQSGWVQSKLYRNMNPLWAKNEYLPLQMKPEKTVRQLELGIK
jgi:penicillin amidase